MNKVVLIGRLTKDPELKFTAGTGTAVTTFTLAVDRKFKNKEGQKETDFINIVAYGKPAEAIANYMKKGRLLAISGRIETRTYEGNDGQKKYYTDVVMEDFQFLEKKDAGSGSSSGKTGGFNPSGYGAGGGFGGGNDPMGGNEDDFFPLDGDNDVPF
jgi:single-strand DNA-binding protein